jgi:hypothetical protein
MNAWIRQLNLSNKETTSKCMLCDQFVRLTNASSLLLKCYNVVRVSHSLHARRWFTEPWREPLDTRDENFYLQSVDALEKMRYGGNTDATTLINISDSTLCKVRIRLHSTTSPEHMRLMYKNLENPFHLIVKLDHKIKSATRITRRRSRFPVHILQGCNICNEWGN